MRREAVESQHIFDLCQCYANSPDAPPKPTGYMDCPGQALDFILMFCCLALTVLNVNSPQVPMVPSSFGDSIGRRRCPMFGIQLYIHKSLVCGQQTQNGQSRLEMCKYTYGWIMRLGSCSISKRT